MYISFKCILATLLGIITVGLLTTRKNKNREKYGRIPQNPSHYPGRKFTSDQPFNFTYKKLQKFSFLLLHF
jgi:hypothetical protein